ncbi:amidase [Micromonospora parathelypteridis]|uniref:Amidase n=1 Tax=Micromonospora parathelypteridis TaxID=1839617 RepID=A0A840VJH0_9ACTN|nr:amidase [Micromonospora parathelypteridis]MBB5477073.1 amidase [Micromonospora parathelypteridis]GGO08021.1 amidase [Micromonospora parathelypteridis]
MSEPHDLTALEQAAAISRGELSSVDLVEHYLRRVAALGDTVGAFVTVTPDLAREAARAADSAPVEARGPLHGVPTAFKDLTLTAGVRTTFGSAAFRNFVPPVDADVVRLIKAAGLVSLGKTTTSELGCSLYSEGRVAPPARNPWELAYTAGGSSGGAAAAVAAGLVPVAQGSDGGGSLRIPASLCGLVGYKPSRGLVSGGPLGSGAFGLPTSGPLGRTVTDVAALLDVMAVPVPGEPYLPPPTPPGGYLTAARQAAPGPLRIGRFTTPMLADEPVHPDCVAAVDRAAALLTAAGHEVVEVPPPLGPAAWPLFEILWYVLALTPVPPQLEAELLPLTRLLRARGAEISAGTLAATLGELQAQVRLGARRTAGCDLLLCPTLAAPQAPVGWFTADGDPAADFDRQRRFSPYCAIFNVTGDPSVSLPLGTTTDGLPVGVLLTGRYGDDARLIATAAQLEDSSDGWDRHPAIWRAADSANVNGDGVGRSAS